MLSVAFSYCEVSFIMLNVIMLSVVMLIVMAPIKVQGKALEVKDDSESDHYSVNFVFNATKIRNFTVEFSFHQKNKIYLI